MLEIKHLQLALDEQPVLHDISFTVEPGFITSLIGPSGAGKSSVLRCIAGLEQYSGDISLNEQSLNAIPTAKRQLGYVEQDNTLLPHLTVEKNITYPLRLRKVPANQIATRIQAMLQQLQITALAKRYPHQLSGGEQRRVMLARTLIYEPKLLLFDEPFAGVDDLLRVALVKLLKPILLSRNVPVLYVTHDLAEANWLAEKTIILHNGKIESATEWAQTFLQQRF